MSEIEQFVDVIRLLRGENGCPWDREQTHASLKAACIEEAAEVVGAVNILEKTGNSDNLREELGDLLLQVVLQAQIAEEEGFFDFEDVAKCVKEKMIRRHPHVFADESMDTSSQVLKRWDEIKREEKAGKEWMDAELPAAFEEAKELIEKAKIRKGIQ